MVFLKKMYYIEITLFPCGLDFNRLIRVSLTYFSSNKKRSFVVNIIKFNPVLYIVNHYNLQLMTIGKKNK